MHCGGQLRQCLVCQAAAAELTLSALLHDLPKVLCILLVQQIRAAVKVKVRQLRLICVDTASVHPRLCLANSDLEAGPCSTRIQAKLRTCEGGDSVLVAALVAEQVCCLCVAALL